MRHLWKKIRHLITPRSSRRYTVMLINNRTGSRTPSRDGANTYGGQWNVKHGCFLFSQECAEWYCFVRSNNKALPTHVQAYVERII